MMYTVTTHRDRPIDSIVLDGKQFSFVVAFVIHGVCFVKFCNAVSQYWSWTLSADCILHCCFLISLVVVSKSVVTFGKVDNIQKLHIRTITLGECPR